MSGDLNLFFLAMMDRLSLLSSNTLELPSNADTFNVIYNKFTDITQEEILAKLRHQKIVLMLVMIFYPVWWLLFHYLVPQAVDPIFLRVGIMALIFIGIAYIFNSKLNRQIGEYFIYSILCLITIHAFVYVIINPALVEARIQLDLTIYATALLLVSRWQLLIYLALVIVINVSALTFMKMSVPNAQIVIFFAQTTFFSMLWFARPIRIWSYLALQSRSQKIQEMYEQQNLMINKLSHDLRTPLVPMVALLPKIEERTTDDKNRYMLAIVGQNVQYMKNLVEKAMAYSFLTSGEWKLNYEIIDLNRLISEVVASFESIQGHRLRFQQVIRPQSEVHADRNKVIEVLYNLLSNAARHTPEGGIICIEVGPEPENDLVIISVTDSGKGMTQEQIGHAFELFYKADKARGDHSSVGLGLPICKEIVAKHGHQIWIESKGLNQGTTVRFALKIAHHSKQEADQ